MPMKLILLQKIPHLGEVGAVVQVKPGYGRNYLIPKGKAVRATSENIEVLEAQKAELQKKAKEALENAEQRAQTLKDLDIHLTRRALKNGKLFGSVGVRDIIQAISEKGYTVDRQEVILPKGPIHEIGEYEVFLQIHSDINLPITVHIEAE